MNTFLIIIFSIFFIEVASANKEYDLFIKKATNLVNERMYNESLDVYSKAIKLEPKKMTAYLEIIGLYEYLGDNETAIELSKIILKRNFDSYYESNKYILYIFIGDIYLKRMDYKNAKKYYKLGLKNDTRDSFLNTRFAILELYKKNHYKSWNYLSKSIGHSK